MTAKPSSAAAATEPAAALNHKSNRFRIALDRAARLIIGFGGVTIIAVILAILFVLLLEVQPLFRSAAARRVGSVRAPAANPSTRRIGVDEYREVAYVADASGIRIISLKDGTELALRPLPLTGSDTVSAISEITQGKLAFATSSGKVIFCEMKFET